MLPRLAEQAGRKTDAGILRTVSRMLSAWAQPELAEGGRQRIILRKLHKLFGLADGQPRPVSANLNV